MQPNRDSFGIYQIPGAPEDFSATPMRSEMDAVQYSPEKMLKPYQHIQDIVDNIHSGRELLAKMQKPRGNWIKGAVTMPRDKYIEKLVELDRKDSRVIFADKKSEMFLAPKRLKHENNTIPEADLERGEVYILNASELDEEGKPTVTRVLTSESELLFRGNNTYYPPTIEQIEAFSAMMNASWEVWRDRYFMQGTIDEFDREDEALQEQVRRMRQDRDVDMIYARQRAHEAALSYEETQARIPEELRTPKRDDFDLAA